MEINSTFVINLPKERERKNSINKELQNAGIKAYFVSALDGHDKEFPFYKYKNLSGNFWRRKLDFKPGAFACYLSHAKCWKEAIKKKSDVSMILEDDASIDTNVLSNFSIDDSIKTFDVIFINKRTNKLLENIKDHRKFIPVSDVLKKLVFENDTSKKIPAPGGDGYIISMKGATKLLEMMNSRKISMGVDYAMFFNSLKLKDIEQLNSDTKNNLPLPLDFFIETEQKHISNGSSPIALESYIYAPYTIVDLKHFTSTINHNVFLSNDVFRLN